MYSTSKQHTLLKKLLAQKTSPDDRRLLNNNKLIDEQLFEEWKSVSDINMGEWDDDKVLDHILRRIHSNNSRSAFSQFIHSGWAACIILLIVCGILAYFLTVNSCPKQEAFCEVITGKQCMEKISLPDGTKVILNAQSKLSYPKQFSGKNREVRLSGQAFFNVHHDCKHPFTVKVNKMNVTALGTSFEVNEHKNGAGAEATLLSGVIQVDIYGKNYSKSVKLIPNQSLDYDGGTNFTIEKVNADDETAWRDGATFRFKHKKLAEIIPQLERWYGKKILCDKSISNHYYFTFSIRDESLESILKDIQESNKALTYKQHDRTTYIIRLR